MVQRRVERLAKRAIRSAAVVCAAAALGCIPFQHKAVAIVPVKENAAAQYAFATAYMEQRKLALVTDPRRYREARDVICQTFAKVYEYFPEDRVYAPLAKLDVIEIGLGLNMPMPRIEPSRRQVHRAIRDVLKVAADYPEHEYVQAKALYLAGMYHQWLGEYEPMQTYYRQLIDRFSQATDPAIRTIVQRAQYFYNQVRHRE